MDKSQKEKLTLEECLQVRNEAKVATILFIVYTLVFVVGAFFIVSQGGRAHLYLSVGISLYLIIGMRVFIPPFHRSAYLELGQPELKKHSSKGVPVSSKFLTSQLVGYGVGVVVTVLMLVQALSAIQPKVEIIDLPTLESSTTEESTTPPSLGGNHD